jgi:hypothetical protein
MKNKDYSFLDLASLNYSSPLLSSKTRLLQPSVVTMQVKYFSASSAYFGKCLAAGPFGTNGYDGIVVGIPGINPQTFQGYQGNNGYNFDAATGWNYNRGTYFGFAEYISNIGRFNGGTQTDIVVSGYALQTFFVYFGDNTGRFPNSLALSPSLAASVSHIAGIGDVNADGYDDIGIITTASSSSSINIANVILGNSNGDASKIVNLQQPTNFNAASGSGKRFVTKLGDINGDGYADFSLTFCKSGMSYVYIFTGGSKYSASQTITLNSQVYYVGNTCPVKIVGTDIDNDGYSDMIVNDISSSNNMLYIIYGSSIVPRASYTGYSFSGIADTTISGFGTVNNIAYAGDFNNDGYKDVVIDCSSDYNSENICGTVLLGGSRLTSNPSKSSLQSLRRSYTFSSTMSFLSNVGPSFNALVGGIDFNNDGYDDIAFGYGSATANGKANAGAVVMAYGASSQAMFPTPSPSVLPSSTITPTPSRSNINSSDSKTTLGALEIILGVSIPGGLIIAFLIFCYILKCCCKAKQNIKASPNASAIEMVGKAAVSTVFAAGIDMATGGILGSASGISDGVPKNIHTAVSVAHAIHEKDVVGAINPMLEAKMADWA